MNKFYKMFLYDMKMTLRQREALFWMFLFPVLIMVILGLVFGGNRQTRLHIGIVDQDNSTYSQQIVQGMKSMPGMVVNTGDETEERAALKDGDRNGLLIIPAGFQSGVLNGNSQTITTVINRSDVNTAQITSISLEGIVAGINERISQVNSAAAQLVQSNEEGAEAAKDFNYIDFMVPGIIAMVIMFSGLQGYSQEIAVYREKGILRRIKVSPLSLSNFLAGGIVTVLIFTLLQAALLLAIGVFGFKLHVEGSYFYMILLIILGALSFLAMGFLVSALSKNSRSAQMAASALAMPMMFLSGVFFPLSIMPTALKVIARVLPLYYLGDALRRVMVDSVGLTAVWLDLLIMVGAGLVSFVASVRFFRWE